MKKAKSLGQAGWRRPVPKSGQLQKLISAVTDHAGFEVADQREPICDPLVQRCKNIVFTRAQDRVEQRLGLIPYRQSIVIARLEPDV